MRFIVAIYFLSLLLIGTAYSQPPPSPGKSDQDAQITLAEAVANKDDLQTITSALKTESSLDIPSLWKIGTLVSQVKALTPLSIEVNANTAAKDAIKLDPKSYAAMATIWEPTGSSAYSSGTGKLNVPVCWHNPTPENLAGRQLTRAALEATWEHHGLIRFVNWGTCKKGEKGINIKIADERPWSWYGTQADKLIPSMLLNFDFNAPAMSGCSDKKESCIWSIAVHEFGHALGLIHEQDSPETPHWCKKKLNPADIHTPEASLKAKILTEWDRYSVMDYCFDIYSRRVQLSDCDIAGYRKIYGSPTAPTYTPTCVLK